MTAFFPPRPAILLALLLPLAALPGCGRIAAKFSPDAPGTLPERPNDSCDSAQYRRYVGESPDVLYDLVMVGPVRMLPPGAAMTMDHNPARVNFDLDSEGKITRIWCG